MLRSLDFDEAMDRVDSGAAFVDLRPVQAYLDVHIPGSLELLYEFGPGFAGGRVIACRCIFRWSFWIGYGDLENAAGSLRGQGVRRGGKRRRRHQPVGVDARRAG